MGSKLIFILAMAGFVTFFSLLIDSRWLLSLFLILPILITIIFLGSSTGYAIKNVHSKEKLQQFFKSNGLLLAWILLLMGSTSSLQYFGLSTIHIITSVVGLNIILRLASYISNYQDGKYVFHSTFLLGFLTIIGYIGIHNSRTQIIPLLLIFIPLYFALQITIVFILRYRQKPNTKNLNITRIFFHFTMLIALLGTNKDISLLMIIIAQAYITLVYYTSYFVTHHIHIQKEHTKENITAEDLLMGEKVLTRSQQYPHIIKEYQTFLKQLSPITKSVLYSCNIILIVLAVILYAGMFPIAEYSISNQILYRLCIGFFFSNFLIMRKDNTALPKIHKIIAFIVINFAVYVNVFYVIGKEQRNLVVLITILRNYTNALAISQSHRIFPRHIFEYEDYQVWVLNNILAMAVNVGLLLYANIDPQLIFAIVCVYLGSYGFLTYYNIKYINTIKEQEEQQHLEHEIEQYLT